MFHPDKPTVNSSSIISLQTYCAPLLELEINPTEKLWLSLSICRQTSRKMLRKRVRRSVKLRHQRGIFHLNVCHLSGCQAQNRIQEWRIGFTQSWKHKWQLLPNLLLGNSLISHIPYLPHFLSLLLLLSCFYALYCWAHVSLSSLFKPPSWSALTCVNTGQKCHFKWQDMKSKSRARLSHLLLIYGIAKCHCQRFPPAVEYLFSTRRDLISIKQKKSHLSLWEWWPWH